MSARAGPDTLHRFDPRAGALKFVSPFGTAAIAGSGWATEQHAHVKDAGHGLPKSGGTNLNPLVTQLQQLDVDVVAYQDEVGCVRNEFPAVISKAAFAALHQAHAHPGTPTRVLLGGYMCWPL